MSKYIILFCLLIFTIVSNAQNILVDSLQRESIELLYNKLEQADSINQRATEVALRENYPFGIYKGKRIESLIARENGKYREAKIALDEAEELSIALKNNTEKLDLKVDAIALNYRMGDYSLVVSESLSLIGQLELDKNFALLAELYNILSSTYDDLDEMDKAIEYSKQSVTYAEKSGKTSTYLKSLYNLANRYYYLDDLDKAIKHYQEVLDRTEDGSYEVFRAGSLDGIGICNFELRNNSVAKEYLENAKIVYENIGDSINLVYTLRYLGMIEDQAGEFKQALAYYEKAVELLKDKGNLLDEYETTQQLIYAYKEVGQYDKASAYFDRQLELSDTLYSIRQMKAIEEAEAKYETEKLKRETLQLQKEKLQSRYIIAALLAVTAILLFLIYFYRQNQKIHALEKQQLASERRLEQRQMELEKREQQRVYEDKINRVFKEQEEKFMQAMVRQEKLNKEASNQLHDDVGNKLLSVVWSMNNHVEEQKKNNLAFEYLETTAKQLNKLYETIRDVSHKMNTDEIKTIGMMYANSNEAVGMSDTKELVGSVEELYEQISGTSIQASVYTSGEVRHLDSQIEIQAYRIIQELTVNVLKHASASRLELQLTYLENELQITLEDNGVGMGEVQLKTKGIGLRNVDEIVDVLEGSWEIDSEQGSGTTVMVDLPTLMKQVA